MNKTAILCDKDRDMMHEFSRLSLSRMPGRSLLFGALPAVSRYLDKNVKKEVDKDRLIIEEAARAYGAGKPACDLDLEDMFEKTKAVDRAFLDSLKIPALSLSVKYSDFAGVRLERIWRLAKTVYALLANWPDTASFDEAVRKAYTGEQFKSVISRILRLYSQETRMLSHSLRLIGPLNRAVGAYAEIVFEAMESVTEELCDSYTKKLFGDKTIHV